MAAADHVGEELLRVLDALTLCPKALPLLLDDGDAPRLVPVENEPYLRQAHPDPLAGPQNAQTVQVLLGVVAMAGGGAPGRDRAHLVPMAQHMLGHPDLTGGVSDPHPPILALPSGRPEGLASRGMTTTDRDLAGLAPHVPDPLLLDVDGVEIATYELAPQRGEARADVVFCHGTPWSARVWAHVANALSSRYRVHLWDMPGYGLSGKGADVPVDLEAQMGRLAVLLERRGLERPHVVAHDIGAAVALGAHLHHGREFASLMLWDAVLLDPWGTPFFGLVAEHADVFSALPSALHRALVREYISGAAHRPLSQGDLEMLVSPWSAGEGQEAFYRQIAALTPEHTQPLVCALDQVHCPVAIGWGAADPWIPVGQASRLRDQLPGDSPLHVLPGVGHLAPLEAPGEVLEAVTPWLEGTLTMVNHRDDEGSPQAQRHLHQPSS